MTFSAAPNGGLEYEPMDPALLERARKNWNMSRVALGEYLGLTGDRRNIFMTIKRMEMGTRPITPMVERMVLLLSWYHSDHGYLPDLDGGERRPRQIQAEPEDAAVRSD